jgi:hypothetical protein
MNKEHVELAVGMLALAPEMARGESAGRDALLASCAPGALDYLAARKVYGLAFMGGSAAPPPLYSLYRKVWHAQRSALVELLAELRRRAVDVLVFKGAETTQRYYRSEPVCLRGDIDLLIRPAQVDEARCVLADSGFVQADYDTHQCRLVPLTPEQLEATQQGRYFLRSFAKLVDIELNAQEQSLEPQWLTPVSLRGTHATLVLGVDVGFGLDQSIGADEVFERSRESVFEGARTLCAEDLVWYTASMFYLQTFAGREKHKLTQLADLAVVIGNHSPSIDWERIVSAGQRYGLHPCIYYPLAYVGRLLGGAAVPPEVLAALDPARGVRTRDHGWQIAKLFGGVDEFPAAYLPALSRERSSAS